MAFPVDAVGTAAACVAGVALGDIDLHFAWQAWRLATWTFDMDVHLPCQAWHLWHWTGSGGALGSRLTPWALRLFAWQAWHLATSTVTLRGRRGMAWHLATSTCILRGWRGTWRHPPSLCVAGVALGDIDRHFAWKAWHGVALGDIDVHSAWLAWHLATSTFTLRGRCGT